MVREKSGNSQGILLGLVAGHPDTNLQQLDSIHNAGLRLALGAFCTSPVSSMYTEANEALLEERRLKLSVNYWITIWKLAPALATQLISRYMNLTQPQEICIFLGQMEKEEWADPRLNPLASR